MKKMLVSIFLTLLITFVLFAFLEGACSIVRTARSIHPLLVERNHTKYDPLLGWSHIPNIVKNGLYGPGKDLRINAQGFRNDVVFTKEIPRGKIRVICTGDSYTLGFGVSNDHTFCAELARIDQRLETVNMGQAGYSVGQAYLWYMRDGYVLDHNIHLVAFTMNAFERTQFDNFGGYDVPVCVLKDGKIAVKNYPIPQRSYFWPKLTENIITLNELNIVKALRKLLGKGKPDAQLKVLSFEEAKGVVSAMFQDLKEKDRQKGSVLVLVLVPRENDYLNSENEWRAFVRAYAKDNGVLLIDLMDGLNGFSRFELYETYALYHFSEKGNRWVARQIYKQLKQFGPLL